LKERKIKERKKAKREEKKERGLTVKRSSPPGTFNRSTIEHKIGNGRENEEFQPTS